jgi:hypothetical protein
MIKEQEDREKEKEVKFFIMLNRLPEEVVKYCIQPFLPLSVVAFLSKKNYKNYHPTIIKPMLYEKGYDTYMRYIIRNDFYFLFEISLYENFEKWLKLTKFIYKSSLYCNYIFFLLEFCIECDSQKCREILQNVFVQKGFNKDRNKYKNKSVNIVWKN